MNENKNFLGTEPIGKLLLRLALPTVAAQMINMLYNIVDRIYIGHKCRCSCTDRRRCLYATDHDRSGIRCPCRKRWGPARIYFHGTERYRVC